MKKFILIYKNDKTLEFEINAKNLEQAKDDIVWEIIDVLIEKDKKMKALVSAYANGADNTAEISILIKNIKKDIKEIKEN